MGSRPQVERALVRLVSCSIVGSSVFDVGRARERGPCPSASRRPPALAAVARGRREDTDDAPKGGHAWRTPISRPEEYLAPLKHHDVDTALVRIPDSSHGLASRPAYLVSKVLHILKWFETHGLAPAVAK